MFRQNFCFKYRSFEDVLIIFCVSVCYVNIVDLSVLPVCVKSTFLCFKEAIIIA